jgi:L-threonylcarbamoyladenylate synthase
MADKDYQLDIKNCMSVLHSGGVILFPTDTIWGVGCDATNEAAVNKVLEIKQRHAAQGVIVLLADVNELASYANALPTSMQDEIDRREKPTTIIYQGAKNVATNVIPEDRTLAIRLVKDEFCQELIRQFGKPIVSTSANIHGHPSPQNFADIAQAVINQVDYVVQHRQLETSLFKPSTILKVAEDGSFQTIRE